MGRHLTGSHRRYAGFTGAAGALTAVALVAAGAVLGSKYKSRRTLGEKNCAGAYGCNASENEVSRGRCCCSQRRYSWFIATMKITLTRSYRQSLIAAHWSKTALDNNESLLPSPFRRQQALNRFGSVFLCGRPCWPGNAFNIQHTHTRLAAAVLSARFIAPAASCHTTRWAIENGRTNIQRISHSRSILPCFAGTPFVNCRSLSKRAHKTRISGTRRRHRHPSPYFFTGSPHAMMKCATACF